MTATTTLESVLPELFERMRIISRVRGLKSSSEGGIPRNHVELDGVQYSFWCTPLISDPNTSTVIMAGAGNYLSIQNNGDGYTVGKDYCLPDFKAPIELLEFMKKLNTKYANERVPI